MVLSNEPGYYEDGAFGIRIENLVRVVKADTKHNFSNRGFLTFSDLTLVPYQTKMIMPELLTKEEVRNVQCSVIFQPSIISSQKIAYRFCLSYLMRN